MNSNCKSTSSLLRTMRILLVGASLGIALAFAFTVAWQPPYRAEAALTAQNRPVQPAPGGQVQRDRTDPLANVTPDLVERVIEVARRLDPVMADELRALCNDHPERLEHALRTSARRFVALAELQLRDPALYNAKLQELETEAEIIRLAHQLVAARRAGDEPQAADLEEQLQTQARVHIALSIKARGDSIRRLEEHIAALRDELEQYAMNFESNVQSRIRQAIDEAERDSGVVRSR